MNSQHKQINVSYFTPQASPQEFNPNKSDAIKSINSQTPSLNKDPSFQKDNLVFQLQQFFQLTQNHQPLINIIKNHCLDPETLLLLIQKSKYDLVLLVVLQTINEYLDENRKSRTPQQYEVPKTQTVEYNKQPQYMQYLQILQRNMANVIHDNFQSLRVRSSKLSSIYGTTTDYVSEHWIDQKIELEDLQNSHFMKNAQEFHKELDVQPNSNRFRENQQNSHKTQGSHQFSYPYLEFPNEYKLSLPSYSQSMSAFYQPSIQERKQSAVQLEPNPKDYDFRIVRQTEPDLLIRKETANFQSQYQQESPRQNVKQNTRVTEDLLESRKSSAPSLKNKAQSPSCKQSFPINRLSRSPRPLEQIYNNKSVKMVPNRIPTSTVISIDNVSRKKKRTQNDSKILFDILRHDQSTSEFNKSLERRNEISQ